MHWFREILVCAILAQFITCMIFTINLVPTDSFDMIVGRLLLWMFIILVLVFVLWYLLMYDKENDKWRKVRNG